MVTEARENLSLYVHIPYCHSKCPYCDFYSQAVTTLDAASYIDALLTELSVWRRWLVDDHRALQSIFIGGGTPSLLSVVDVERLLNGVASLWPLPTGCEVTLEANPESVCFDKLQGYRRAGVNRLSLGIQAFDDNRLRQLGRCHDLATARQAIRMAQQAGFASLNLDLIYATPGHDPIIWQRELTEAMAWQPDHLSCYELTLESGQQQWSLPDEEQQLDLWRITRQTLAQQGWQPYEVSNFARPGQACRHNRHYWDFGDYIAVGAAAHGKWTDPNNHLYRSANESNTRAYLKRLSGRNPTLLLEPVNRHQAARECLMMGLRTTTGLHRQTYESVSGYDLLQQQPSVVQQLAEAGLLTVTDDHIILTESGTAVANAVMLALI
ncbi:MAG: radical SAM family heme chaperone HemW [Magnetococcales bacterium]|nr:radical SAM family heme chaperone HemW [Magnetococcales bacterium]